MIGGSISFGARPRRRTLTYTARWQRPRVRRPPPRAPLAERVNNGDMLFDRPASLPIATIRSTSTRAAFASQLRGLRTRSWRWARPRLVPLMVAVVGMLAVLGAAEYLTHLARYTPAPPVAVIEAPAPAGAAQAVGRVLQPASAPQLRVVVLSAP